MTPARRLILVCNSHIDPLWLWPWEEGLAAALATFRSAADLCDEFDGFVFCHNEALLYQWVEEHEPRLFGRIQRLVRLGRWHVSGGWFLQPDCNLPSGESFVRQIGEGLRYFGDRFGVRPRAAFNVDAFGHSRGLVQILAKAGYTGYLFCRPDARHLDLPADDFVWVGYDGSTLLAHRSAGHYNSELGRARAKVEGWLRTHGADQDGLVLWGVGNHGGGPSRGDLRALAALAGGAHGRHIVHGRPEDYFDGLEARRPSLPRVERDLNPWAPGCYTSMATVKRAHRRLEALLFATEKTCACAAAQGLLPYPAAGLDEVLQALLFTQFHDVLAGTSVEEAEAQALRRLGLGLDLGARLRARAFFALISNEPQAQEGEYPLFVHNPHPFPVTATVVCEMQPPEPNPDSSVCLGPEVAGRDGRAVPAQVEKESGNIQVDQRKRIVFRPTLEPSAVSRFACRLRKIPRSPAPPLRPVDGVYRHRGAGCAADIDGRTGLLARYCVDGVTYVDRGAFRPLVMRDSADPWGMQARSFRDRAGEFLLLAPRDAAAFAGVAAHELPPVRVIEDGPVRTIVEALFGYGRSVLRLRYALPRQGAEVEVEARATWAETDAMLKLAIPTALGPGRVLGQVAFGVEEHRRETEELVCQQWVACVSADGAHALTVINDAIYGFDFSGSELRLSCLRSPAYAGHPVDDRTPVVRQDRAEPRVDRGEHVFRFWLAGGPVAERLTVVDREATARHEAPMALVAFPPGTGGLPALAGAVLSDEAVQMPSLRVIEDGRRLIVRLFEPTGRARTTTLTVPALGLSLDTRLGPFEIKTLAIDLETRRVCETDLLNAAMEAR